MMMHGWIDPDCVPDTVSCTAADVVPVGSAVAVLATGFVKVPDVPGLMFAGVAVQPELAKGYAGGSEYQAGAAVAVVKRGRIWVYSEIRVNPTLPVYFRHTANGTRTAGDFRADDDDGKADLVTRAKWVSGTIGPGLALLELNLP